MALALEAHTTDSLEYSFFPVPTLRKVFRVRASHDAHIILSSESNNSSGPFVEIFLGGWNNEKSAFRLHSGADVALSQTSQLLNGEEFRNFVVEWTTDGALRVYAASPSPILEWKNPEPFPIDFFGIRTHWGATGTWSIDGKEELETDDSPDYSFFPIEPYGGRLDFTVRASNDAHICLVSEPTYEPPIEEIFLGGWENGKCAIRHDKTKPDLTEAVTPNILSSEEDLGFWIEWHHGGITVGKAGGLFMEVSSRLGPHPIAKFGIRTAYGSEGTWKFYYKGPDPIVCLGGPGITIESGSSLMGPPESFGTLEEGSARTPRDAKWVEEGLDWVDITDSEIPENSFKGGVDGGEDVFIIRAHHEGELLPGKFIQSQGVAFVPWGGGEHAKTEYEVLVVDPERVSWVKSSGDVIPENAIPCGYTSDCETLYIGRAEHDGNSTVGKIHPSHGSLYIPYGGEEVGFSKYEVLVKMK